MPRIAATTNGMYANWSVEMFVLFMVVSFEFTLSQIQDTADSDLSGCAQIMPYKNNTVTPVFYS